MKEFVFWIVILATALGLIPLGLWGIPILIFLFVVAGTKLRLLDWKELKDSLP
jgi:hypothetical protein